MRRAPFALAALASLLLAGCDLLGIEGASAPPSAAPPKVGDRRRLLHAARVIEDCYTLNRRIRRHSAGWREMTTTCARTFICAAAWLESAAPSRRRAPDEQVAAATLPDAKAEGKTPRTKRRLH
jgi:hypothetical protein